MIRLPSRPRRGEVYWGWWMVAGGFAMQTIHAVLIFQSYGAYVAVLRDDFGWSKTLFSVGFAMSRVESGALGPVQGWLVDRFGPRRVMQLGLVIMAGGFFFFSQLHSPAEFLIAFFIMSVGAGLAGFMTITTSIVKWFERRRATALGLMSTGLAVGGLLVPVLVLALDEFGWRNTAFASGILVLALGLPLSLLMRSDPESYGYHLDGAKPRDDDSETRTGARPQGDFTAGEALRTGAFWFLALGHASALLIVSAVMVHLVVYLNEELGYSLGQAGLMIALMTALMIVGQIGGGVVGDRVSKRGIVVGCMVMHVVAMLILANATALWMVALFAVLHGLAWGTRGPLLAALRADYFGRTSFGVILGLSSMIIMLGMVAGPIIAGVLADETGNYTTGFTVLAIMAAIGSLFFVLARPPRRPGPAGAGAPADRRLALRPQPARER